MNRSKNTGQWLIVLFCVGFLFLNYPLLALYSKSKTIIGIPFFFVALFLVWAALIGLVAVVIERQSK